MTEKPLLSVVEVLPNQNLAKYQAKIYDPEFWKPLIPLNTPIFKSTAELNFEFEIDDKIILDPTGTLFQKFNAKGEIIVEDKGTPDHHGKLWNMKIVLNSPPATVYVRIRARDLSDRNALKIGIFILSIEHDQYLQGTITLDAILFAIRLYLRELIKKANTLL